MSAAEPSSSISGPNFLRRARRNWSFVIGSCIVLLFAAIALFGPWLAPYDPYQQRLAFSLETPSLAHPLGRDELGRDILSRILAGGRYTLGMAFAAAFLGLSVGVILGALSGYRGGKLDAAIMAGNNILLTLPELLIAIAIITVFGAGLQNLVLAIGLAAIPTFSRLVRGQVLSIRKEYYVDAAVVMGFSTERIIIRHILPNIAAPLLVHTTYTMAAAILIASGLSFLGLGAQPPISEWGVMLSRGRDFLRIAPHVVVTPGIFIAVAILGLNLLGDGLRDLLDPRMNRD